MRITYDPTKNKRNIAERGLPFTLVADLDWPNAITMFDTRRDYGETRLQVFAMLGGRLHMALVTRRGEAVHVISFRKANGKKVRRYGQAKV